MSSVIKSHETRGVSSRLAALELPDVQVVADKILARAQREADSILVAAREEATKTAGNAHARIIDAIRIAKQRGYAAGHAEGVAAGTKTGQERGLAEAREKYADESATITQALTQIIAQWQQAHRLLFVDARRDVVALIIAAAQRVIPQLVEIDPAAVAADAGARALETLGQAHRLTLRLNPADLDAARNLLNETLPALSRNDSVAWHADPAVDRGGAIVETDSGALDARISVQITRLADEMLTGWRERVSALTHVADSQVRADTESPSHDTPPSEGHS